MPINSSSSDTSEASEDIMLESDIDSPNHGGGIAAENGMSERQTLKINSGSFGMFNRPMLNSPHTPRTPDSQKRKRKRKRKMEYSGYMHSPRSNSRSDRRQYVDPEVFVIDDDKEEDEQSLFVPDTATPLQPIIIDDEELENEKSIYDGMTIERRNRVQQYLEALAVVETADRNVQTAESQARTATAEHEILSQKLTDVDSIAAAKIADTIRARDKAISIATEHAEDMIQEIRERVLVQKEEYERRLQACEEAKKVANEQIKGVQDGVGSARKRMVELETEGGFELGKDVMQVQARKVNRRT
jgi:hypothetical protein